MSTLRPTFSAHCDKKASACSWTTDEASVRMTCTLLYRSAKRFFLSACCKSIKKVHDLHGEIMHWWRRTLLRSKVENMFLFIIQHNVHSPRVYQARRLTTCRSFQTMSRTTICRIHYRPTCRSPSRPHESRTKPRQAPHALPGHNACAVDVSTYASPQ